jgi:hypothetical protein
VLGLRGTGAQPQEQDDTGAAADVSRADALLVLTPHHTAPYFWREGDGGSADAARRARARTQPVEHPRCDDARVSVRRGWRDVLGLVFALSGGVSD